MVALPAFKFVFLAIRQVTRPVARQIVARANTKRALTYRVCIGLGRVSLGLSGVISEWTRAEEQKLKEAKRKSEEESSAKAAAAAQAAQSAQAASDVAKKAAGAAMDAVGAAAAPVKSSAAAAAVVAEPAAAVVATKESSSESAPVPAGRAAATPATVTPRSRSLLQSVVYGPQPKGGVVDTYDSSVFLDPSRTVGEAARVFIRYPTRSAWDVFRQTFLDPFPEDRLVAAGADLLIELVAYTVLCTLLVVELLQQSRTSAAKEAHLQARLEAIESKVNELVEHNNSSTSAQQVEELPPVPELHVTGRLGALWGALTGGVGLVEGAFVGDGGGASAAEERERLAQSGKAVVPQRRSGSSVACAPPRDPSVKVSKHDDSVLLQAELDHLLRTAVHVEKRT